MEKAIKMIMKDYSTIKKSFEEDTGLKIVPDISDLEKRFPSVIRYQIGPRYSMNVACSQDGEDNADTSIMIFDIRDANDFTLTWEIHHYKDDAIVRRPNKEYAEHKRKIDSFVEAANQFCVEEIDDM